LRWSQEGTSNSGEEELEMDVLRFEAWAAELMRTNAGTLHHVRIQGMQDGECIGTEKETIGCIPRVVSAICTVNTARCQLRWVTWHFKSVHFTVDVSKTADFDSREEKPNCE
jgi:hypothetical protein